MEKHQDFTESAVCSDGTLALDGPAGFLDIMVDPCPKVAFSLSEGGIVNGAQGSLGNFGYRGADLRGRDFSELLAQGESRDDFQGFLAGSIPGATLKTMMVTRRGEAVPVELVFFGSSGGRCLMGPHIILVKDLRPGASLDSSFNTMNSRVQSLGLLVSGICHEILNPLHIIFLSGQLLLADRKHAGEDTGLVESIMDEVRRIEVVTDGLLTFAGEKQAVSAVMDLNQVVREGLELIEGKLGLHGIEIVARLRGDLPEVLASPKQLGQAFFNVVSNARDSMAEGGTLTVSTRHLGQGRIQLEVKDTGEGIPPGDLACVFDPFFTTKPPGRGTGLGLSVAQRIVEDHGGKISIRSVPGRGTTVTMTIPATPDGEAAGSG